MFQTSGFNRGKKTLRGLAFVVTAVRSACSDDFFSLPLDGPGWNEAKN